MQFSLSQGLAATTVAAVLASPAFAGGEHWTEDFTQAQETAETQGKDLFLDFTGSDWCPPCIALSSEVFTQDIFHESMGAYFVFVELDYPNNTPQPDALRAQNQELAERYSVESFPTILLADAQGRPYAQVGGYRPGSGPEAYIQQLQSLMPIRASRDEKFAAAEEAAGIERAQLLHEGLQIVGDELAVQHYGAMVDQVIELDADNAAGLRHHYEVLVLSKAQRAALQAAISGDVQGDPQGAIDQLDTLLADAALMAPIRQEALMWKAQIEMFVMEDQAAAKETLEAAIAVDPDSKMGQMLRGALEQHFPE